MSRFVADHMNKHTTLKNSVLCNVSLMYNNDSDSQATQHETPTLTWCWQLNEVSFVDERQLVAARVTDTEVTMLSFTDYSRRTYVCAWLETSLRLFQYFKSESHNARCAVASCTLALTTLGTNRSYAFARSRVYVIWV